MTRHQQKQMLISPKSGRPPEWDVNWAFPKPFPPGWPRKWDGEAIHFSLGAHEFYNGEEVLISCEVLDRHEEASDALLGYYLEVTIANCDGLMVRMRKSKEAPWSRVGAFQVREVKESTWGIHEVLKLNLGGFVNPALDVSVSVYGVEGGPFARVNHVQFGRK